MSEGLGTATSTAIVGNFVINVVLSGTMNLLWGMLHAMQMLSYLPLINVMMPANALIMFQVMIRISNFEIIDTEAVIDDV